MRFILSMLANSPILRLVRWLTGFPLVWLGTTIMDQRDSNQIYRSMVERMDARDAQDDAYLGPGKDFS